jgi:hypothetical protein
MGHMPTTDQPDGTVAVPNTRQIVAGTGLSGGGDLSADRTIDLEATAVTPGAYTSANITVDQQGRITAAASGSGEVPSSRTISTSTGLTGGGDLSANRTLSVVPGDLDELIAVATDGVTITGDGTAANPLEAIGAEAWFINVKDYGAVGDGVTDDRLAIVAAETAGIASGGKFVLFFPAGEYIMSRNAANAYSWDLAASNVTLLGIRGKSWLKHPTGMPNASVALLRVNYKSKVTIKDLGFDGNWGNAVTTISSDSSGDALPQATINVTDTTGFPSSGTFQIVHTTGPETITYTGKTARTFTGCTGGTGTLFVGTKVGYIEDQSGINHTAQVDPKNYLLMVRGATDLLVDNCVFRQAYGDFIWCGYATGAPTLPGGDGNSWTINAHFRNCVGDISARNGFTLGQGVEGVYLDNCRFTNIQSQALDSEPVDQPTRNVYVHRCYLDGWWIPSTGIVNAPVSIAGGTSTKPGPHAFARAWRLTDNIIMGSVILQMAEDIELRGNTIICDFDGDSYAPILCQMHCDGVRIVDNFIYDRTGDGTAGQSHDAAIHMEVYSSSNYNGQPSGVIIRGNRIIARNGHAGIFLNGTGGGAYSTSTQQADDTGTATGVAATTLTDTGKAWTVNQWSGWMVRRGTAWATVVSNTATVLTLDTPTFFESAWFDYRGKQVAVPSTGTYQITTSRQIATIEGNDIDCSNDGYGQGGVGIHLAGGRPGGRMTCRNNRIRNASGDAIKIEGATTPDRYMPWVEVTDNKAFDDQATPTCTNTVRFINPQLITKLVLRGNSSGDGVTNAVSGLTTGTWLINDGMIQEWAGYGAPGFAAPIGSTYRRVDGGAGTTFYVNETGLAAGWAAK